MSAAQREFCFGLVELDRPSTPWLAIRSRGRLKAGVEWEQPRPSSLIGWRIGRMAGEWLKT